MSIPIFCPSGLIEPLLSGYSAQDKPKVTRLQMEVGEARETLLAQHQGGEVRFNALFDNDRRRELMVFYRQELAYGTVWFSLPVDTGDGLIEHRVKFSGAPQWRKTGRLWQAAIRLEFSQPEYTWE